MTIGTDLIVVALYVLVSLSAAVRIGYNEHESFETDDSAFPCLVILLCALWPVALAMYFGMRRAERAAAKRRGL